MKKRPVRLSIILIIILGICVYLNSLNGKFLWDDILLIRDNVHIKDWSYIKEVFTKDIVSGAGFKSNFYRPIQMLTYMLDYSIWELNVFGYHLTNTILHILVGLGIYWLVYILYKDILFSFLTGILFVVHPIHTEAVAYISGRADSLSLLFILLCLISYIRNRLYPLMLVCYIAALLSKETSLILPVLIVLYHYAFREKIKLKEFVSILAVTIIYILLRFTILSSSLPHLSSHTTLFQRLPGIFVAITNYLRLLLFPFGLHMEYGHKLFKFTEPTAILGVFILVSLLIYSFKKRYSNKLVFFSISWFFITLIPVSNLYPLIITYMAEHWLYLPSMGFFFIMARGLSSLYKTKDFKIPSIVLIIGLLSFYSFLTIKQNETWREPISFYERTLKYSPESVRTITSLGNEYTNLGKIEEAIALYEKALALDPNYAYAYNKLGTAYRAIGENEKAIVQFKRAIELKPNYADAYNNLGVTYNAIGKLEEAIALYKKALEINPYYARIYNNLGNAYSAIGKHEEAVALYKKALKINPNDADIYYNLATTYAAIGEYEEAIELYKKAMEINPNDALTHYNLALTYYYVRQYDLAIKHFDRASELGFKVNPEFLERLKSHRR